jgi:hypothetical protein
MNTIGTLFQPMDNWRHLPSYQLERWADLFFSLYLPEVLEAKLGYAIGAQMVPEFPVRIGTIYPEITTNKSYKVDYLALSADGTTAILVELKTEGRSRRRVQDRYLEAARDVGLPALLEGVLEIFRATQAKRKYFCLLQELEMMGLLRIPAEMEEMMSGPSLQGVVAASRGVEITTRATVGEVVYVQPRGVGPDVVTFAEFAAVVRRHEDAVSRRFAQSLGRWAEVPAGRKVW